MNWIIPYLEAVVAKDRSRDQPFQYYLDVRKNHYQEDPSAQFCKKVILKIKIFKIHRQRICKTEIRFENTLSRGENITISYAILCKRSNPSLLVMLADISPLSVPEVRWKKSDKPLGDEGPLLDTNDGGPLHTMPAHPSQIVNKGSFGLAGCQSHSDLLPGKLITTSNLKCD